MRKRLRWSEKPDISQFFAPAPARSPVTPHLISIGLAVARIAYVLASEEPPRSHPPGIAQCMLFFPMAPTRRVLVCASAPSQACRVLVVRYGKCRLFAPRNIAPHRPTNVAARVLSPRRNQRPGGTEPPAVARTLREGSRVVCRPPPPPTLIIHFSVCAAPAFPWLPPKFVRGCGVRHPGTTITHLTRHCPPRRTAHPAPSSWYRGVPQLPQPCGVTDRIAVPQYRPADESRSPEPSPCGHPQSQQLSDPRPSALSPGAAYTSW